LATRLSFFKWLGSLFMGAATLFSLIQMGTATLLILRSVGATTLVILLQTQLGTAALYTGMAALNKNKKGT